MIAGGWVRSWAFRSSKGEGQCDLPANSIFGALDADNHVVRRPDGDADAEWRRMRAWQDSCRGRRGFFHWFERVGYETAELEARWRRYGIRSDRCEVIWHTVPHIFTCVCLRRHKDNTHA